MVVVSLFFAGCGDLFDEKSGELEAKVTLNRIQHIEENPNVKNPLPEIYRQPPKRMRVKDSVKIFYFTKHHDVNTVATLVTEQLAVKVSQNYATQQLIINCANDEESDKVLEYLAFIDVAPTQINIDCIIVEYYADMTMDRETTIKIDELFGENIVIGGKIDSSGNLLPNFPGASLRESRRSTFGLNIGYWGDDVKILIDILESHGYLKILMNQKLEVVNGKTAKITNRDQVPIEKIVTQQNVLPYSITEYQWVEDSLEVTPHVYADGSIGLTTHIRVGSSSKPKGVVQQSIITDRSINIKENRIEPGKSLIIGGFKKTEKREVIRGAPFLKDLPIIGLLFSSRDFEESAAEIVFILTPSISSGGIEYAEMLKDVREKHASPKYKKGLETIVSDPFGGGAYTKEVEKTQAEARSEKLKSEQEKVEIQKRLSC